jgi:hypothetical protein
MESIIMRISDRDAIIQDAVAEYDPDNVRKGHMLGESLHLVLNACIKWHDANPESDLSITLLNPSGKRLCAYQLSKTGYNVDPTIYPIGMTDDRFISEIAYAGLRDK